MIKLGTWAKSHGIPITRARKDAREGRIVGVEFTDKGIFVPTGTLPQSITSVVCLVCQRSFQQITERHMKTHNLTLLEYRQHYPDAILLTTAVSDKISKSKMGHVVSDAVRSAVSRANTGNKYCLGRVLSDSTKNKISQNLRGRTLSQSHRDSISRGHVPMTEETRQKITDTHRNKTPELKAEMVKKIKSTLLSRYGVENAIHIDGVAEKIKATNQQRYGVDFPLQSKTIQDEIRAAFLSKYGTETPSALPEVIAKRVATNQVRYGRDDTTNFARHAYEKQTGYDNPFKNPDVQKTIRATMLERYGSEYPINAFVSSHEIALVDFLKSIGVSNIETSNRKLIYPQEIDIFLPDYNIGIEFCGIYWHGEMFKGPDYHVLKDKAMSDLGHRLITIFEDEWVHSPKVVMTRLRHILGKCPTICGARSLKIESIDGQTAKHFFDEHHLQGFGPYGFAYYGAKLSNKLVAAMSFSKARAALGRKQGCPELLRFATDGYNYPGVASRLFHAFLREHDPEQVISYADKRWSAGNLYSSIGFDLQGVTRPNYWYTRTDTIKREHRFKYRKDQIINLVENGREKTEFQIMTELGRDRIWDCGNYKFVWNKARED